MTKGPNKRPYTLQAFLSDLYDKDLSANIINLNKILI